MSGNPRRAPPAYRRYDVALGLLRDWGLDVAAPSHPPHGFTGYASLYTGRWLLLGRFPWPSGAYVQVGERLDTRRSYPQPWGAYEYLVHVELPERGRNVSFHMDRTKPRHVLYHWHDYPDGQRRSEPTPMGPVSLRWFLEAAWAIAVTPGIPVQELLLILTPPGPADPE